MANETPTPFLYHPEKPHVDCYCVQLPRLQFARNGCDRLTELLTIGETSKTALLHVVCAVGEKAGAIVTALKKAYPQKKIPTLSYICSGAPGLNGLAIRNRVVQMAELKHKLNAAPAYTYYFTWQTPILDGLPGAWHTAELAFCFDNTKRCEQGTGHTPEAQALAKKMAASWAKFAATGDPSLPKLAWQPSDPTTNRTFRHRWKLNAWTF